MTFFPSNASPSFKPSLLYICEGKDASYIEKMRPYFMQFFGSWDIKSSAVFRTKQQLLSYAQEKQINFIATSSLSLIKHIDPSLEGSANDNIGYVISYDLEQDCISSARDKLRICLFPPLVNCFAKSEGIFELAHYAKKLAHGTPVVPDQFRYTKVMSTADFNEAKQWLDESFLIAIDIETGREQRHIKSISYTGGKLIDGKIRTNTFVIPLKLETLPHAHRWMKELNLTKAPKVMQNGQYDSAYLIRFNAPVYNYIFDTYNMMHAMYCELPKDLAYMSAFFLDTFRYWKDEGETNLYMYNGKDTHNTFWLWLAMMEHKPDYADYNYISKFKMIFPCLTCALEGQIVDVELRTRKAAEARAKAEEVRARIDKLLGIEGFNPNSHIHVKKLMKVFMRRDPASSDELSLIKFMEDYPIAERLMQCVLDYRGAIKAASNYYEFDLWHDRLFYQLDPSGTETGRMASKASMFWCGTQVQNIPAYARDIIVAEEGWTFAGVDKSQSESYCTGYISQEENLINNVVTSPDFHCGNASMFFRVPFETLYDAPKKKVLQKEIRKLAKPINHGANYNMGAATLRDTIIKQMGSQKIREIGRLLKLSPKASLIEICQKSLDAFDAAYPTLRSRWYREIVTEVVKTGKLVTPLGYTRRTFLKPHENKLHLNACVAHKPQSFSVELVNEAFFKIWRELQLKKYKGKFRLKKQVHDEIVFMATDDIVEQAAQDVADMMVIPTEVNGRIMTIPSTIAMGKTWADCKD